MPSEPATLSMTLDEEQQFPGDRVAALVDAVAQTVVDGVELVSHRARPVVLEFSGTRSALERMRASLADESLRSVLGSCRFRISVTSGL
ncbi:MAG: hypothetical protein KDK70_40885, partial [Myxococcales bacterium]|nr:hypothetical protein [Myxococcales bacterium]